MLDDGWLAETANAVGVLAADVEAVDLRSFEAVEPNLEMARLVVCVDELAARAVRITKSIITRFDAAETEESEFDADEITAVRPAEIGSIAFVAQLELRQCRERLAIRSGFDLLAVLDECDRTLRRILRALRAIDSELARVFAYRRVLGDVELLSRSLRVRSCYAELSIQIARLPEPTADTIKKSLRLAGTAIAILIGKPVYPELRVGDRLQLRGLQYRISSWLRGNGPSTSPASGLQLWSDITAFLRMLQQVNQRPELLEHDAEVLREARRALESEAADSPWPEPLFAALCSLRGRDPNIDELLAAPRGRTMAPWRQLLGSGPGAPER